MQRSRLFLATVLVTFGCADAPDPGTHPGAGGKADGELTTVYFEADWSERADGPLVAGLPFRVAYDVDRLTACRGYTNGSDVWSITGYASFDGAAPEVFEVTRLVDGRAVTIESELEIPARATRVELWFQNNDRWGCDAYDSNENANYAFAIEQRANVAIAAFEADGSEELPAAVKAGDQLVLHYAPERLAACETSTNGTPSWGVTASYQIDDGIVKKLLVTRADGAELVAADPEITVPRGSKLAIWFEATNRYGCHVYDSNDGANYAIAVD